MFDASTQLESGLSLKDDVANLLTDTTLHDLTIVCSDNIEIRACRTFLATRSSVFKRMLYGPETRDSHTPHRIHLKSTNSKAVRAVLHYIHTETIDLNPLSPSDALETYHAAALLHLPKLMKLALEQAQQGHEGQDLEDAGRLLNRAVDIISSDDLATTELYDVLMEPFCRRLLAVGELNGLSERSLELLLTRTNDNPLLEFHTPEHILLLCVVDWVWSRGEQVPDDVWRHACLERLRNPAEPYGEPDANMHIGLADSRSLESMRMMWRHIDLDLMCPHRVRLMTEAIDVITDRSPQYMALSQIACVSVKCPPGHPSKTRGVLTRGVQPIPAYEWQAGERVVVSENGAVIECHNAPNSCCSARLEIPFTTSCTSVCEWEIVIESSGVSRGRVVNTVGFVGEAFNQFNQTLKWNSHFVWCFHSYQPDYHVTYPGGTACNHQLKQHDIITFRLNMNDRTCSFSINGHDCGVVWRNLPDKVYPAVTLWTGNKYRYRQISH